MMQVAQLISEVLGEDVPVRVVAYDGSKAGPDSSDVALRILSPRPLALLVTAPGPLGLAINLFRLRRRAQRSRPTF